MRRHRSLPPRERELKQEVNEAIQNIELSLPPRERELKPIALRWHR